MSDKVCKVCGEKIFSEELCKIHFKEENKLKKKALEDTFKDKEKELKEKERLDKEREKIKEKERISDIKKRGQDQYNEYREEFEDKYFMILGKFFCLKEDGEFVPMSDRAIENETSYMLYDTVDCKGEEKKEKFLKKWIADFERPKYNDLKCYPPGFDGEISDNKYYNLWDGFIIEKKYKTVLNKHIEKIFDKKKVEFYEAGEDLEAKKEEIKQKTIEFLESEDEDTKEKLDIIFNHINLITGGHKDFFLKYFAWIIQKPGAKTQTSIVIRDVSKTFTECGGTGKNLLIDYIGENIIGNKHYRTVSENSELFESFNTSDKGQILVFVEEADGNENKKNDNSIKSKITKKKVSIQGKGQDRFEVDDFANYVFTTNKRYFLNNRRFAIFDVNPEKRGNVEYFNKLVKIMDVKQNFKVAYHFYKYLNELETWKTPAEIQAAIPKTSAKIELARMNTDQFGRWLSDFRTLEYLGRTKNVNKDGTTSNRDTATNLFNNYQNWHRLARDGTDDKIMKLQSFCAKLSDETDIFTKVKNNCIYYETNTLVLIDSLRKKDLIDSDYTIEMARKETEEAEKSISGFPVKT